LASVQTAESNQSAGTAGMSIIYMYKFLFDLTDGGNWLVDVHASS
jgi:hypothetical protein